MTPMRKTATAQEDCKGHALARELLEECETSEQMTPEQAYAHWLSGEIGNQRSDRGHKVHEDDTERLCATCPGYCPSGDYCHAQERAEAESFSFPAMVFLATLALACFGTAAYLGFSL